jgi:hypothetical protein
MVPQALRLQVPWVQPPAVLRPERREHQRSARQAAARRVVPAVWLGRPHSEASLVRRAAAVAPSCFRQAEERWSAAQSEPAWWQAPAAAWRRRAVAAEAE